MGWAAGGVRARAMTRRRLGRGAARGLAASGSVQAAVATLVHSPYGHDVRPGQTLAEAQRAVVETVLWNLRVLAGWAPREGATMLRVLLGAIEIGNVEDHLRRLAGAEAPPPYHLGGAGHRLVAAGRAPRARPRCASSSPHRRGAIPVAGRRARSAWRCARRWPIGSWRPRPALPRGRQGRQRCWWPGGRPGASRAAGARRGQRRRGSSGRRPYRPRTLPELVAALPASARWALADVRSRQICGRRRRAGGHGSNTTASRCARRAAAGPEALVGAAALLAADAWRVRAALELAARGGAPLEVFDAVA